MLNITQSALLDPITNRVRDKTAAAKCIPILSVSINQIIKLFIPQIGLIVHKHLIGLVKLVVKVDSKLPSDLFTSLHVSDGTHTDGLKVVCYRGSLIGHEMINPGDYVKISGKIKAENGYPCLVAYSVVRITDANEITLHCCEVVRESLELRKIKNNIANRLPSASFNSTTVNTTTTAPVAPPRTPRTPMTSNNSNITTAAPSEQVTQAQIVDKSQSSNEVKPSTSNLNNVTVNESSKRPGDFLSLNGLQADILNLLGQCNKVQGLTTQEICDSYPNIPVTEIQEAINFLETEAHIYTTIDDEHFASVWSEAE